MILLTVGLVKNKGLNIDLGLMFLHQKTTLLISCLWSVLDSECSVLDSSSILLNLKYGHSFSVFCRLTAFSSLSHYKGPFQQHWFLFNLSGDRTLTVAALHQHLPAPATHINLTSKLPLLVILMRQWSQQRRRWLCLICLRKKTSTESWE